MNECADKLIYLVNEIQVLLAPQDDAALEWFWLAVEYHQDSFTTGGKEGKQKEKRTW